MLTELNVAFDQPARGIYTAIPSAFGLHHVGHNHTMPVDGRPVDRSNR